MGILVTRNIEFNKVELFVTVNGNLHVDLDQLL